MERIGSRKNPYIRHVRQLSADAAYRREQGEYVCDGMKALREALAYGAQIRSVLWKEQAQSFDGLEGTEQYLADAELFDYASALKNSPGPLLTVKMPPEDATGRFENAIVLENVQDPGNVGTVIRTANAFGVGAVLLVGNCADLYNPKTVRATMGAIFRQKVIHMELSALKERLDERDMPLYGAALSDAAQDIRTVDIKRAAVAVGSEGSGLSQELLKLCAAKIIIPMRPDSESLNAAVAASVLMWEMAR